ncbi:MAG: hypothetical protein QOK43_3026 [Acidimicrobiaceae bacterium]|nr:hypothetical protein [Acidimicrobiaceae bacterium]
MRAGVTANQVETGAGAGGDTRPGSAEFTPALLEAMWPVAHRRLVTALRAAGADEDKAEEAVAEAFTRALARRLVIADVDEFCRWAFVVARNAFVDAGRKSRRVVLLDVMPEAVDPYDLASHVESRERLQEARAAIAAMSSSDRGVLIDGLTGGEAAGSRKEAVSQAVRRHRARARLRQALGAPVGWLGLRKPRWLWRLSNMPTDAMSAMIALPFLAVTATWFTPSAASTPDAVAPPAVIAAAAPAPVVVARPPAPATSASAAARPTRSGGSGSSGGGGTSTPDGPKRPLTPGAGNTSVRLNAPTGDHATVSFGFTYDPDTTQDKVEEVHATTVIPLP